MDETRYPLCWPAGWKRAEKRSRAQFGKKPSTRDPAVSWPRKNPLSVYEAVSRIDRELRALYVPQLSRIISTNIPVRLDGVPRSDRAEPRDPGVAIYWSSRDGKKQCMAIDRYDRVADNLAAVAATLEALRAIERHGGGAILDRAFAGFAQLPESINVPRPWRVVLSISDDAELTKDYINQRFREMASLVHPDKPGGSHDQMTELNRARDLALAEVRR